MEERVYVTGENMLRVDGQHPRKIFDRTQHEAYDDCGIGQRDMPVYARSTYSTRTQVRTGTKLKFFYGADNPLTAHDARRLSENFTDTVISELCGTTARM